MFLSGETSVVKSRSEMVEETRAKLIQAARASFAQYGYANASMDELTAGVGLTRGALYHNFGDKKGLLQAVIDQIDTEMATRAHALNAKEKDPWKRLMAEAISYIEMAQEPEVQRIMLRDGPAVLGDPSQWPSQNVCLGKTIAGLRELIDAGVIHHVDAEATARLLNGAALNAAMWIASSDQPKAVSRKAVEAFRYLANGLLRPATS
ncbi:TetR/AcrR family transcriptional regulator [Herbaspirillum sp. WKF16]|uniref:TetR/AcrR family transcriptional regulator n=1 Tax=Herbaspirillum sp. WKF16 TaxID=3028312 RepID=UPI0023A92B5A|nr:TetR/AcrR family transcriptional regulator [Herbaspirillum sp. WKF16]WDZ95796.1 TetR/AcrR family transcriptional regulator [Herbaspirillum sp. WKF16]